MTLPSPNLWPVSSWSLESGESSLASRLTPCAYTGPKGALEDPPPPVAEGTPLYKGRGW